MDEREEQATAAAARRVLDVGALRALGHPLRVKMFDILSQEGPQTASTLAEMLGESSGATSYHLRALARHHLIRELPEKQNGRERWWERWWERPPGGIIYDPHVVEGSPAGKAALQIAVAEVHRKRHDELMEYFGRRVDLEPREWADASSSMTSSISLTAAQTSELIAQIEAVIDAAADKYRGQEGEGVRRVSVRSDVFVLPQVQKGSHS